MRIPSFFGILAVFFLISCSQNTDSDQELKTITLKMSDDILPISSFASSTDYIELKLSGTGKTLGEILAVKKIDDDWIIKHRLSGHISFIRFNRNGEFIAEFPRVNDNKIRNVEDIIAFKNGYATLTENGIHEISKNGKYIGLLVRGNSGGDRFFEAENHFFILNDAPDGDLLLPAGGKKGSLKAGSNVPDRIKQMVYSSVENMRKNRVDFYSAVNDTVFSWHNNEQKAVVVFSGDEMPTFAQLYKNMGGMDDNECLHVLRETRHVMIRNYLENDDFRYVIFWVGSNSTTAIINKQTGVVRFFGQGMNDIDGGVWDRPFFLTSGNELVIPITAYKISGHKIINKKERNFAHLQEKIAASGNPVLMLCKLK